MQERKTLDPSVSPALPPPPTEDACASRFGPSLVSGCGAPEALYQGIRRVYLDWLCGGQNDTACAPVVQGPPRFGEFSD